jgi:hypothetical protein
MSEGYPPASISLAKLIRQDPPTACGIVQEQAAAMHGCLPDTASRVGQIGQGGLTT